MSIRNNNIETTNSINVVQSSNQEKHLENTNYQNLPKSQSSNIENPHPTSNKLEIKDKKQIFNKNLDSDYKSCSQKLISLVTSILFKNKVVLFETIDDWVSRDIMPLIPDLENQDQKLTPTQLQPLPDSPPPAQTSTVTSPPCPKSTRTSTLNKYFPNLGWRLDHNKIFEKSQKVIPKVRAFLAKMIRSYFTIDYNSLSRITGSNEKKSSTRTGSQKSASA